MKTILENLPISIKLMLSFGFMLVLSLSITFTGWTKLDDIIAHGDKLSTIQKLNKIISDAKATREDYMRTHDESHGVKLATMINAMTETILFAQSQNSTAEEAAQFKQAINYINDYKETFNRIVPLVQAETRTSKAAFEQAEQFLKQNTAQITSLKSTALDAHDWQNIAELTHISLEVERIQRQLNRIIQAGILTEQTYSELQATLIQLKQSNIINSESLTALQGIEEQIKTYMKTQNALDTVVQEYVATAGHLRATIDTIEDELLQQKLDSGEQARSILLLVTSIVMIIGIAAPLLITNGIARPLRATVQAAKRIASGDLTQPMSTTRSDEIGTLQNAMGSMTSSLRELIDNVSVGITDISSGASQLSAVSEQNRIAMTQQQLETEQVATAMNQMAATVHEVACHAEQTAEATGGAEQLTNDGYNKMTMAITTIEELNTDIEKTAQAMQELAEQTNGISRVMDVIKSVAEQTNLLALNAAIEAARAGESGRGFAVVADEVRSLAKRTQDSTDEIENMIQQLQAGAQNSLQMMEHSLVVANTNVTTATEVGTLFEEIRKSASSVQMMSHQIAAASEEQSTVAEEINRSISQVNDISNQTAASSAETAVATEKLVALGSHLQTAISQFRLS